MVAWNRDGQNNLVHTKILTRMTPFDNSLNDLLRLFHLIQGFDLESKSVVWECRTRIVPRSEKFQRHIRIACDIRAPLGTISHQADDGQLLTLKNDGTANRISILK